MAKQYATLDNLSVFNEYMPKMTPITQAAYDLLTPTEKNDPYKVYFITDATVTGVDIDDTTTALNKVWSSSKVSQSISNPNLVDNPFFTVNQRGLTAYTTDGYTVDRWKVNNGITCEITDNGISITHPDNTTNANFLQYYESDRLKGAVGKNVTVSVMTSDGTIYSQTAEVPVIESTTKVVARFTLGSTNCSCDLIVRSSIPFLTIYSSTANATVAIKAIKLEVGSISTLHLDTAPNYQQELAKCKRYFQKLNGDLLRVNTYTARLMFFLYPLEVEMRTAPAVVGTPIVKSMQATPQTGFTFAYNLVNCNQAIQVVATKESHGLTDGYVNCGNDGLQLSADL